MRAFRQPLSQEEERRYLSKALQGDMEARNYLVLHNMRLIAHIVKKYHNYEKVFSKRNVAVYGNVHRRAG